MTLYSHLTVQAYHDQLSLAMKEDALQLLHSKKQLINTSNLVQHTPKQFLQDRPLIVVYSVSKPLGLFEHFMGDGGKTLTKAHAYAIAKVIEIKYKILYPTIMLPISVSEINTVYDATRSKIVVDMLGSVCPGGMYGTVMNRLMDLGSKPVDVPPGLVITQHDNDQALGPSHETKVYNKQKLSLINANAHIVCETDNYYQYTPESYPGHTVYRDLTSEEIKENVPKVITSYKPVFRGARVQSAEFAIQHLQGKNSHEVLVNRLNKKNSDFSGSKICKQCGVVTRRTDIQRCVDCSSGHLVKIEKEIIFTQFIKEVQQEGLFTDVRYNPFAGQKPVSDTQPNQHSIVPGDPDMIPPTTKENVAEILNTAGHR